MELTSTFALTFVHPFWLTQKGYEIARARFSKRCYYGSYRDYTATIKTASEIAHARGLQTIFFLPFEQKNGELKPVKTRTNLPLHDNDIIFEWSLVVKGDVGTGSSYGLVTLHNGTYHRVESFSGIDGMVNRLHDAGLREMVICGEMGPHDRHNTGCAGLVAVSASRTRQVESVDDKLDVVLKDVPLINVRGLEWGIYPREPYEKKHLKFLKTRDGRYIASLPGNQESLGELRNVTRLLYEDVMTIKELETIRPPPTPFTKEDFCIAVCGRGMSDITSNIARGYVQPVAEAPGDIPTTQSQRFIRGFSLFMNTSFAVPLLNDKEKVYGAYKRFKAWEEHKHPRDRFPNHDSYWGQTYQEIEQAYKRNEPQRFMVGIATLVDKILHD